MLDIDWAVHVLAKVKGLDFPVGKDELIERLKGMIIKGKKIEDILSKIDYPIRTPAELLHKIREKLA